MKAQILYDFRNEWEFCSGTDLHDFFREQLGDPSPSGYVEVDFNAAMNFVVDCSILMANGSPSIVDHCKATRRAWWEVIAEQLLIKST
jgi:hypothetical protein